MRQNAGGATSLARGPARQLCLSLCGGPLTRDTGFVMQLKRLLRRHAGPRAPPGRPDAARRTSSRHCDASRIRRAERASRTTCSTPQCGCRMPPRPHWRIASTRIPPDASFRAAIVKALDSHLGLLFKHGKGARPTGSGARVGPDGAMRGRWVELSMGRLDEPRGWWMKPDPNEAALGHHTIDFTIGATNAQWVVPSRLPSSIGSK